MSLVSVAGKWLYAANILEPCAGDGAIIKALANAGVDTRRKVTAYEVSTKHLKECEPLVYRATVCDALKVNWPTTFGTIVMNPPFKLAFEFCEKAIHTQRVRGGAVLALMRVNVLAGQRRRDFWEEYANCDVHVLAKRPLFKRNGRTDATEYAWFEWSPRTDGRWTRLEAE